MINTLLTISQSLWSDLDVLHVQPAEIHSTAKAIRDDNVVVDYELLRPFIVEAVRALHHREFSASDALSHVHLQFGRSQNSIIPKPTDDKKNWLLKDIIAHLHKIISFGLQYEEEIKKQLGGRATSLSLPEVLEKFIKSGDMDIAQLFVH